MKPEIETHSEPDDSALRPERGAIRIEKRSPFLRAPHDAFWQLKGRQQAARAAKKDPYLQRKLDQVDKDC